ncbi:MAG: DUF6799 domain-containing protein [Candidatus Levyibacteriota bacterium]
MKNTVILGIVVALIIGFSGGFAVARGRYLPILEGQSASTIAKDGEIKALKEKIVSAPVVKKEVSYGLENGKLMVNDNGKLSATTEATLVNKTKIAADGTVTRGDGTKIKLVNGEWYSASTSTSATTKQ